MKLRLFGDLTALGTADDMSNGTTEADVSYSGEWAAAGVLGSAPPSTQPPDLSHEVLVLQVSKKERERERERE